MKHTITPSQFTQINCNTNGNPRFVLHFLMLADNYTDAMIISREFGGKKYHNRQYGGGIAFVTYNINDLCNRMNATK